MKRFIVVFKIFIIGALLIISNGNLALRDSASLDLFVDRYQVWLGELFEKGVTVVGYVISNEWLPDKDLSDSIG